MNGNKFAIDFNDYPTPDDVITAFERLKQTYSPDLLLTPEDVGRLRDRDADLRADAAKWNETGNYTEKLRGAALLRCLRYCRELQEIAEGKNFRPTETIDNQCFLVLDKSEHSFYAVPLPENIEAVAVIDVADANCDYTDTQAVKIGTVWHYLEPVFYAYRYDTDTSLTDMTERLGIEEESLLTGLR